MYARLLLLCLSVATACGTTQSSRTGESPQLARDEHALCELAAGRTAGWRGLAPFDPAKVPSCFGVRVEVGTIQLYYHEWRRQRFVSPTAESWLYDDGKAVALVAVFPSNQPSSLPSSRLPAGRLEAELGPAPWKRDVTLGDLLNFPELPPRTRSESEWVYANRGLALLVDIAPDGSAVVQRIRGFAPTDAKTYSRRFLDPPVEWFDL